MSSTCPPAGSSRKDTHSSRVESKLNSMGKERLAVAVGDTEKRGMKRTLHSPKNRKRPRITPANPDTSTWTIDIERLPYSRTQYIRVIQPYPYTFTTFCKARWIGRSVLDVYHEEFGSYPRSYYESAIRQGRILVSTKIVDPSYRLKGPDVLSHTVHRHEPAVAVSFPHAPQIRIVYETPDVLVVDKPGTLPVHPCGGYHGNSVVKLLAHHHHIQYFNIHRLDRLTSGLCILAKNSSVAKIWSKQLANRGCQKLYLARVKGKFPFGVDEEIRYYKTNNRENTTKNNTHSPPCQYGEKVKDGDMPFDWTSCAETEVAPNENGESDFGLGFWVTDSRGKVQVDASLQQVFDAQRNINSILQEAQELKICAEREGSVEDASSSTNQSSKLWFHLACPVRVAQPKDGICEAGKFSDLDATVYEKTVKPAQTSFAVVSYNVESDSTLLLVSPSTGRTHQIRLHLKYLNHPIANDPNYGGDMWYNDDEGRRLCGEAREKLDSMDNLALLNSQKASGDSTSANTPATEDNELLASSSSRGKGESVSEFTQRTCVWCARGKDRTLFEFLVRSRGIWLHALQYTIVDPEGKRISYRTDVPEWSSF